MAFFEGAHRPRVLFGRHHFLRRFSHVKRTCFLIVIVIRRAVAAKHPLSRLSSSMRGPVLSLTRSFASTLCPGLSTSKSYFQGLLRGNRLRRKPVVVFFRSYLCLTI